jgi:hypothetical protein
MQFDAACMRFGRTEWLALVRTRRFVDRLDALPRSVHPMVYRQAGAERPVLHVSSWFALRIVGHDYAPIRRSRIFTAGSRTIMCCGTIGG